MRSRVLTFLTAMAAALGLGLVDPPTAGAISGGTPDTDDRYAAVGLTLFYDPAGQQRCSATLVSPTVMLTAAHCGDTSRGATLVDFRSFVVASGNPRYPVAADRARGYTENEITDAGFVAATPVSHPSYAGLTDRDSWYDVAVLLLSEPVTDVAPLPLAPVGTLDAIRSSDLGKTLFRSVGYGVAIGKGDDGPQKPQPLVYPLERRYADEPGRRLTPQLLYTNGNENDAHGTGGSCFGDSGGPLLTPSDEFVGVISFGQKNACRYLNASQRVDIASVRDWLDGFLA